MFTSNHISRLRNICLIIVAAFTLQCCIKDDIPYPRIQPNFTEFQVKDATSVNINTTDRVITIVLPETVDIENVEVESFALSEKSKLVDPTVFDSPLNLSKPLEVSLRIYQDYQWTIVAVQNIERYFTVDNQVGNSVIDPERHTVVAQVPLNQPLNSIEVKSLKLAGPAATYSPALEGTVVDFSQPVAVDVTEYGRVTRWTIEMTRTSVAISSIDPFTMVAWIYADVEVGKTCGMQYRVAGAEEWTQVPAAWITQEGGSITGCLRHLTPQTAYEARAYCGDAFTEAMAFTTGSVLDLPNGTFQNWNLNGITWYPNESLDNPFWGTGNPGATKYSAKVTSNCTTPIDNPLSPTGFAGARLESKNIVIRFAAGNLFTGDFAGIDGVNGILKFGREFDQRPTKMKARINYKTANINKVSTSNPDFSAMKGQPDTCIVWIALCDFDQPLEIRTNPSTRQLFDQNADYVIAYGQYQSGADVPDYIDVDIPLTYRSTSRKPKYVIVTCSASKYGDYFTGGVGAVLNVASLSLAYDLD